MFGSAQRGVRAYARVGVETGIEAANPHKLILILYDGALHALVDAKLHMARGEIAAKGSKLSRALSIIENGLKASLDIKAGGELAERLAALYDYMCDRLLFANLNNRPEVIDEVSNLLNELRGAWEQIGRAPAPTPAPSAAAERTVVLYGKA